MSASPPPAAAGWGLPAWRGWLAALLLMTSAYCLVFLVEGAFGTAQDVLLWSLSNAVPHVLMAIPLVDRVAPLLARMRLTWALPVGVAAGLTYALAAYCAVIFLLAVTSRVEADGIFVRFFSGPAVPWQMMQGSAYAAIALMAGLWLDARRQLAVKQATPAVETLRPQRWLVKTAEGIVPVDPEEIVRIEAAGEYCRLVMPGRVVLARIGMTESTERMAALPFLRVHRSHLVNSDAIVRAEAAGNGRLQLTLRNGDAVVTSREGARLVRETAV